MWNDRHADEDEANKCGAAIPRSERCVQCERPLFDDWKRTAAGRICLKCAKDEELTNDAVRAVIKLAFERVTEHMRRRKQAESRDEYDPIVNERVDRGST